MEYEAHFAGSWYPEDKTELNAQLNNFFQQVTISEPLTKVQGIIVPHAGYLYSGLTAAYGFKALADLDFDLAVILAPSHKISLKTISIFNYSSVKTPLGSLKVDTSLNAKLIDSELYSDTPKAYIHEHSFELELPFLQYIASTKSYKILPLIIGDLSISEFKNASDTLSNYLKDRKTIFITSSDFTHYGSSFGYLPFIADIPYNLEQLDLKAINFIEKNDLKGFVQYFTQTGITICGINPIIFMMTLLDKSKGRLLSYTNSGKISGDYSHCVSYASIAFN